MVTHRALYLSSANIVTGVAIGLEKVAKEDDVPSSDVCQEALARLKRRKVSAEKSGVNSWEASNALSRRWAS
jgi:hypothetical protein